MEIVPAIIAKDFKELEAKIRLVEPFVKTVQIDVMDGVFVSGVTWPFDSPRSSVEELAGLNSGLALEVHLMTAAPQRLADEWLASRADSLIWHWETFGPAAESEFSVSRLAGEAHQRGKKIGVALNMETPLSVLDDFIKEIDFVLLMSVPPGRAGRRFDERVLAKISALRQKYPDVKIEVDGGVNSSNILKLAGAGADFLAMGSAIFGEADPGKAIKKVHENLEKK